MKTRTDASETHQTLEYAYRFFNAALFDGALHDSHLTTVDRHAVGFNGTFTEHAFVAHDGGGIHKIELNSNTWKKGNSKQVLSTLVHEMVHGSTRTSSGSSAPISSTSSTSHAPRRTSTSSKSPSPSSSASPSKKGTTMGRTRTPAYRVEFKTERGYMTPSDWNVKGYGQVPGNGKPTSENLDAYVTRCATSPAVQGGEG